MLDKMFKLLIDSMLIVLLIAIVALPAATTGWIKLAPQTSTDSSSSDVLPAATYQPEEIEVPTVSEYYYYLSPTPETEESTLSEE